MKSECSSKFLPNPSETRGKYLPFEAIIFPKFHKNWAKNCRFFTWALRFQNCLSYKISTLCRNRCHLRNGRFSSWFHMRIFGWSKKDAVVKYHAKHFSSKVASKGPFHIERQQFLAIFCTPLILAHFDSNRMVRQAQSRRNVLRKPQPSFTLVSASGAL